jgi:hypothetical protein
MALADGTRVIRAGFNSEGASEEASALQDVAAGLM